MGGRHDKRIESKEGKKKKGRIKGEERVNRRDEETRMQRQGMKSLLAGRTQPYRTQDSSFSTS